ncbi:hypothetical protein [Bosea sp. BK604]|uniref:hypothetical protein n=1 Tax=Bosea sp. BK604 TaxID=2512180 RepID=UPI001047A1EC|nr:hypothetical protein [Bosea sp. BK604]TCR65478.1 hypothetical protein EV560_105241 [Bosea sp. BK604]
MTKLSARRHLAAAALSIAALCGGTAAPAADIPSARQEPAPPLPLAPRLTFTAAAYLWATGIDGRLRTLPPLPAAQVSIGFDQVIKNFDGGIMGAGELAYDRYLLFFDVIASKISPNRIVYPAGYPAGVKIDSGSFIGLAAAGYRLIDDPAYSVDAFAGIRGFAMNNTLRVQLMPATLKLSDSEQWVDGVVGARLKLQLTKSLYATTIGFVGAGGSRYEWDVFGGLGYQFDERWSAFAGYRAMKVDYRNGSFIYDALQQGPVLGVSARF